MHTAHARAVARRLLPLALVGLGLGCIDRSTPAAEGEDARAADATADSRPAVDGTPASDATDSADGAADAHAPDVRPPDAELPDARPPDARPPDARPPDAQPPPGGDGTHFIHRGRCFEHTPRCGSGDDCDPGLYRGCLDGRCHLDLPCGCASDDDCAPGDLCLTNERFCDVCAPAPARCPDGACPGGEICVDGWCRDECPEHGDGPPLDCRGEPPLGRCAGWSYLREAGTCVPVDAVGCVRGQNTFGSREDCLTHCRGEAVCTATIERVEQNTERRVVECAISHGPGACVALAHCICELGLPELPNDLVREELRGCAFWWTVPRGAITFADYCGEATLAEVVDRMEADGFQIGGPDLTIRLSPGCAEVRTDRSIGPTCLDGVQNGWETGVDCGIQGCEPCR